MKYRAVLFDLDGTLLDTLQDLAGATNKGLSCLGFPQHRVEAYKYFVGAGREEMALRALPEEHRDAVTVSRLVEHINREYADHWADHTRPYAGVPELLDALTARGTKTAVLSNKPQNFTELMVSRLLSSWQFEIVAGSLPAVPKKPDSTAALKIVRQMNTRASEFLYLGDSGIDMQTAVNAGMYPVGALWGYRTAEELKASGAKALIDKPTALLEFFSP